MVSVPVGIGRVVEVEGLQGRRSTLLQSQEEGS